MIRTKCYGIDQQGGKGMCGFSEDVIPTLASDSHGTPHAICYKIKDDTEELQNVCTNAIAFQLCGDRDNPSVSYSSVAYCIPANPMSDRGQHVVIERKNCKND